MKCVCGAEIHLNGQEWVNYDSRPDALGNRYVVEAMAKAWAQEHTNHATMFSAQKPGT